MKALFTCLVSVALAVSSATSIQAQKKGGASAGSAASSGSSSTASSIPAASSTAAIESQMLTFGALDLIAKKVAAQTCSTIYPLRTADGSKILFPSGSAGERTVVIFDQTTFANLAAYQGFVANALALKSLYFSLLTAEDYPTVSSCIGKMPAIRKQAEDCIQFLIKNPNAGQPCTIALGLGLSSTIDPFSDATSLLSMAGIR